MIEYFIKPKEGGAVKEGFPTHIHRAYRHIPYNGTRVWWEAFLLLLIILGCTLLYIHGIHNVAMESFISLVRQMGIELGGRTVEVYLHPLMVLDTGFRFNDFRTEVLALLGLAFSILFIWKFRAIPLNFRFWLLFFLLAETIFVTYFILWGEHYPYTPMSYIRLYLYAYIGFSAATASLFGFLIALLPLRFPSKVLLLLTVILYYWILGFLRLLATQLIVDRYSVMLSPFLYFTVFFDYLAIVMLYGYLLHYLNRPKQKEIR
jgi:hypothetical protein